jgi:ATP phosphoribosyltransferase
VNAPVTIALPKGRLLPESIELFGRIGLGHPELTPQSRQLSFRLADAGAQLVIVRDVDVATYVEYGAADLGVVGKDRLLEERPAVYEPLDLRFGPCRIVLAEPGRPADARREKQLTRASHKLSGTIELAPLVGLADQVVDIVDTGATLRAHQLVEVEELARSTARLIVNRASLKTKHHRVHRMMQQLMDEVGG